MIIKIAYLEEFTLPPLRTFCIYSHGNAITNEGPKLVMFELFYTNDA